MKEVAFRVFSSVGQSFLLGTSLRRSSDAAFLEDSTWLWLWFLSPSLCKLFPAYLLLFKLKLSQTGKAGCLLAQFLNLLFHIFPITSFPWPLRVTAPFNHTNLQQDHLLTQSPLIQPLLIVPFQHFSELRQYHSKAFTKFLIGRRDLPQVFINR